MSARPRPEQAHCLGGRRAGGGGEQWRLSFHSLCDKQLGVVRAVCPGAVVPEELYCYPNGQRLCSLASPRAGAGRAKPRPLPGMVSKADCIQASAPGHGGCGRRQPCGGLVRVALRVALGGPRRSEAAPSSPRPSTSCLLPPAAGWCSERRQGRRGGGFRESCL